MLGEEDDHGLCMFDYKRGRQYRPPVECGRRFVFARWQEYPVTLAEDATRPEKWVNCTHLENSPGAARYVYNRRCTPEQGP